MKKKRADLPGTTDGSKGGGLVEQGNFASAKTTKKITFKIEVA